VINSYGILIDTALDGSRRIRCAGSRDEFRVVAGVTRIRFNGIPCSRHHDRDLRLKREVADFVLNTAPPTTVAVP
jgi:hypothetical protein